MSHPSWLAFSPPSLYLSPFLLRVCAYMTSKEWAERPQVLGVAASAGALRDAGKQGKE
jgi:hypothetical protein